MLGIDLTNILRFKNPTKSFLKKILHIDEIIEYEKALNKPKYLAARWAIKEALYKANNDLVSFSKIRIEKIGKIYTYPGYIISTSTEGNYYIAIVNKEQNES